MSTQAHLLSQRGNPSVLHGIGSPSTVVRTRWFANHSPVLVAHFPYVWHRFNASLSPGIYVDIDCVCVYTGFLLEWMFSLIRCTLSVDVIWGKTADWAKDGQYYVTGTSDITKGGYQPKLMFAHRIANRVGCRSCVLDVETVCHFYGWKQAWTVNPDIRTVPC